MDHLQNHEIQKAFKPLVPIMRPSRFAELVGVSPSAITALMNSGFLPVVVLKPNTERPTRYINLVMLFEQCLKGGV